jgi:hypothetical protein
MIENSLTRSEKEPALEQTLDVHLTDALRKDVIEGANVNDVYATPSEYIHDLIRQDMQDRTVALKILEGLGGPAAWRVF